MWDSFANDLLKSQIALPGARANILPLVDAAGNVLDANGNVVATGGEDAGVRPSYFNSTYDKGLGVDPPQPVMWYGQHWEPCKSRNIKQSRLGRHEDYDTLYRQWHWRIGYEMLVYSFTDGADLKQPKANPRYLSATSTMLLASGEDDNYNFANIFPATMKIASLMVNTPGQTLFLEKTGHSIHDEQPGILANAIFALILDEHISPLDPEGRPFGEPCTWPEQVDLSLGQFNPGIPLKLHWVVPGQVDPGCAELPRTSLVSFPPPDGFDGPKPS